MDILAEIVARKQARINQTGYTLGFSIPARRQVPLRPFIQDPFLICEIKRKSPSKGDIATGLDAVAQAALYEQNGIKSVSVLTEQDYFAGSLNDLIQVKQQFPQLAVLRKDFLLSIEEIDVSCRAGADAVLLIAGILEKDTLAAMYARVKTLGMQPLVEVHSLADIGKVRELQPELTGINARDLKRFAIDLTIPLQIKRQITWQTNLLFESGIRTAEDARFALSGGFRGLLVGEAVVRNPALIAELRAEFSAPRVRFWQKLYSSKPPYAKVCGITNREDALQAAEAGADLLGFIFATSKRRAAPALLEKIAELDILKVAVVVTDEYDPPGLPPQVKDLLAAGLLDAVQFAGNEQPDDCSQMAFPYYKVIRINSLQDIEQIGRYRSPRVLVDAFAPDLKGGTGKVIPATLVQQICSRYPLWIAGGIGPANIREIMESFLPELVDASSKLEKAPGVKDPVKICQYLKAIKGE